MRKIQEIRAAEASSHIDVYTNHELYTAGSWLAKPVRTVLDLLPLFADYDEFCCLDLGCASAEIVLQLHGRLKTGIAVWIALISWSWPF